MSGKPSLEGVELFRQALHSMACSSTESERIRLEINSLQAELNRHQQTAESAYRDIFKLLQGMDVYSSGNTGFEGRFSWFMTELYKQITKKVTK